MVDKITPMNIDLLEAELDTPRELLEAWAEEFKDFLETKDMNKLTRGIVLAINRVAEE
jgi:hypothetical protein